MDIMSRIETYTPQELPIPAIVVSEPRVLYIQNPRDPSKRLRQVVATVVQMNPNPENLGELYKQEDVLLNFAVERKTMRDPETGETFHISKLPEHIKGLDVDKDTGEVLSYRQLLERTVSTIVNRAAGAGSPSTETTEGPIETEPAFEELAPEAS